MKKIYTLFSTVFLFFNVANAQDDVGVIAITSPVSGCALTTTETVTIDIFNFGTTDLTAVPFIVEYTINGGPPVSEPVSFSPFLPSTTVSYSFVIPADLSAAGTYTLTATTLLTVPPDANNTNDAITGYLVTNSPTTVGGIVSASATVCSGTNSGTVTLAGETGSVLQWEQSIDGGFTWTPIVNTTTSHTYNNLVVTTMFRALVQSGTCPSATSTDVTITVDPVSVGGSVTADATVCESGNAGVLTLSGETGSVLMWQFSTDGGFTWTNVANTTNSQAYLNLVTTTMYRAVVQSGVCASANSSPATITVDPISVGGTVSSNALVCEGSNSGTLTLSGQTGSVISWEYSTDGGSTWNNIVNTTTSQAYSNLIVTTLYRAQVQSGVCAAVPSGSATITVSPTTVDGAVTSDATVCSGSNSGTLTLSGHVGSVLSWEQSIDGGFTWTTIVNTTTTQTYLNLVTTTLYRAIVQSGACPSEASTPATITVIPVSVGGTVTPAAATVCAPVNSGLLTLSGQTGSVVRWEYSTDGGFTWIPISNTTTTHTFNNLSVTTRFRAVVQNGGCATANSAQAIITVTPASVGGSVASNATVCAGSNSGTLTLSGHTGSVIRWQFSTDGGFTWTNIVNTTTTQTYLNLLATRMYRAQVQNGACTLVNSSAATITVNPITVGGSVTANATVCSGSNSGTLTLAGHTGSVIRWEQSIDGGFTWTTISNTTTTQVYNNLTQTTMYRAVVQSGVCASGNSAAATITVNPPSVGGTTASNATVCSGNNSGTVTLSGQTGNVLNWEQSIDGGFTWTNIVNTTTSHTYTNIIVTTMYRAVVQSLGCASATSSAVTITTVPGPTPGTVNASATVCAGTNSGTLTLTGNTGTVSSWEPSTDGGFTWVSISNTTNSQMYNNLTMTTMYRARVTNGICPAVASASATITVDPVTVAGTASSNATVCATANSGTITLSGNTGNVTSWEFSIDNGFTWNNIVNTTTSQTYTNLIVTTWYRALVLSGVCAADTSNIVVITVDPTTVGGTLTANASVCAGNNTGTINLAGQVGTIDHWEFSTDMGSTWIPLVNNTNSYTYNNLNTTTLYRVYVTSGSCAAMYSTNDTIFVSPQTIAGTISSNATVCASGNAGTINLTGNVGNVTSWEFSTDGGFTWNTIINTTTSQAYLNLITTTMYRAIVLSGVCLADTTNNVTITVDPVTVGGNLSPNDTVCASANSGTITLAGQVGTILNWEYSTDWGSTWIPFANTTNTYNYLNLTTSTLYRAWIQSGVCAGMYSTIDTIMVDAMSNAGTIMSSMSVCEGTNGLLTLNGYSGNILDWMNSTDGGTTWNTTGNTNDSLSFTNLSDTTWYFSIAQSGVCPADTSAIITVIMYPKPVASFISSNVCDESAVTFNNTTTIASGSISTNFWDFGDGNNALAVSPAYTYADTGTYTVTLYVESNNGCRDTAVGTVIVYPLPDAMITASGSTSFCADDSLTLTAPIGTDVTYLWNTGDTTMSIVVDSSGWYMVTVTDTITGCLKMDSIMITVFPLPVAVATVSDSIISVGQMVMLNATGGISYSWLPLIMSDPFTSDPSASPTASTNFTVYVTDGNGCMNKDSVYVQVDYDYNITISNLMTPNGDGFNDNWFIKNILYYPENLVSIFNRNGQEVYSKDGYNNSWDGTNKVGQALPDGTYYYVLKFTDTEFIFKGSITILSE